MRICLFCIPVLLCSLLLPTAVHCQLQKIYLHPKAPAREKQSQFVDSVRFIPLEIKEGIHLAGYSGVQVAEKYFMIVDYASKFILLYSKDGRFVRKINYSKLGENFNPSYDEHTNQVVFFGNNNQYTLTAKDELKIMLDWNNPRNKKYFRKYRIDLNDTSFAIVKDVPNENDIIHGAWYYDDYYWRGTIMTSPLFKDSLDYEFKIYRNNQLVKGFFPYNRVNEPKYLYADVSTDLIETDTNDVYLLTRPYCDTIYKVIRDSLFPAWQVVLPVENNLPDYFFTKPFKNKTERENFFQNNGAALQQLYDFYETPRFIFLSVAYFNNFESYIYKKQDQVTYKVKNISADSTQYGLPLLSEFNMQRKDGHFYLVQKAGDLLTFFQENPGVPVPPELDGFLKNKPHETSPIIVEFKFRN